MSGQRAARVGALSIAVLAYAAASLFHHIHNAEFLGEYPNMPVWLSRAWVYAAWCGVTAVGVAGLALLLRGHELVGLLSLGAYAAFGLDGLGHYALAPVSDHTLAANVSIWLEVTTALLLLAVVATFILRPACEGVRNPG
jgi:hypothetical protein